MSVQIKILPHNISIRGKKGEILSEVLHRADIPLEAECAGQGTCGTCAVQIVDGRCERPETDVLTPEMRRDGYVLACRSKVSEDITIKISKEIPKTYDSSSLLPETEIPLPADLSPLSKKVALDIGEFSPDESISDLENLNRVLSKERGVSYCTLSALRNLPEALRSKTGSMTATTVEQEDHRRMIKLEPGMTTERHFGIACDIGTTTVALRIVDLNTGQAIANVSAYNDQIQCGADVISRIIYAQKPGNLEELNRRIVLTVNRLLDTALSVHKLSPDEITSAVFSGNTTMTHLLLKIDPKYIREEPYVPAVNIVPLLNAKESGIHIHPDAVIFFTPSAGSYVGGDIAAGMLCTQLKQKNPGVELFIDVGTNGELVISGDDWMLGCACSAGPAFEGAGIKCGMRASPGAIDAVDMEEGGSKILFRVIGDGKPSGICGSGLVELVAGLFTNGVIGRDGKFNENSPAAQARLKINPRAFIIVEATQTATGKDITISEQDITNIMRAKAAVFSASSLLLRNVGLSYENIERVYVAGGFGCDLDFEKAITIGLFPDIARNRFEYLGNTSLLGAHLALLSSSHRKRLVQIARNMTYIDLSSEVNYMNEYTGALFLPHTDENLFPTAKKLLPK